MSARCTEACGLARFPKGHPETTEADMQRMMAALYAAGWGYNAIADLCGRSHDELRKLLLRNFPGRPEAERWPG
jgi:hypothetical protein